MSKYAEEMDGTYKDLRKLKEGTKSMIKDGVDIAFKEFHDANSFERLKKRIMK